MLIGLQLDDEEYYERIENDERNGQNLITYEDGLSQVFVDIIKISTIL